MAAFAIMLRVYLGQISYMSTIVADLCQKPTRLCNTRQFGAELLTIHDLNHKSVLGLVSHKVRHSGISSL